MNLQRLLDTGWKLSVILCSSILMLAAFRSPQAPDHPTDEIRAQRFVLVDAEGKELGEWGRDKRRGSGTALILYNQGPGLTEAIALRVADGKAELEVRGGQDNGAVMLSTDKGSSSVCLFDCCLEPACNSTIHSCRAALEVLQAGARMHLDKTNVEHEPGHHIDASSSYVRFPDSPKAYKSMDRK